MTGTVFFVLLLLFLFLVLPYLTARMARHKGRSPRVWFFLGLLLPGIAMEVLHFLPYLSLTCARCGASRTEADRECRECGASLPDHRDELHFGPRDPRLDGICRHCAVPYRSSDYRPDVEKIYCSACGAELPRHLGPATHNA